MLIKTLLVIFINRVFSNLLDLKKLKPHKLKKIVEDKYDTKVKFLYKTKLDGIYIYIFVNDYASYAINEF